MKVNEIFYSLQGEGYHTGRPAVFVRLSGCNLKCDFCDTAHDDGREMDVNEIVRRVSQFPARHVVITGGEPTLQITAELIEALHHAGYYIQIETNGSVPLEENLIKAIDWITCSPKNGFSPRLQRIDELKALFDANHTEFIPDIEAFNGCGIRQFSLQPCDRGDTERNARNLSGCITFILANPRWRLSLQTHKILGLQ